MSVGGGGSRQPIEAGERERCDCDGNISDGRERMREENFTRVEEFVRKGRQNGPNMSNQYLHHGMNTFETQHLFKSSGYIIEVYRGREEGRDVVWERERGGEGRRERGTE